MSLSERFRALFRRVIPGSARPAPADASRAASAEEVALLDAARRCTACLACDVAFDGYADTARSVFHGPSELPLAYAPRLEEHGLARAYVESLRRGDLEMLTRVCPVSVPFVALADLVERRARTLAPTTPEPAEVHDVDKRARHDPG